MTRLNTCSAISTWLVARSAPIYVLHATVVSPSRSCRKDVVKNLFSDIAPQYDERAGGYTRILKGGFRKGDNARALFETV